MASEARSSPLRSCIWGLTLLELALRLNWQRDVISPPLHPHPPPPKLSSTCKMTSQLAHCCGSGVGGCGPYCRGKGEAACVCVCARLCVCVKERVSLAVCNTHWSSWMPSIDPHRLPHLPLLPLLLIQGKLPTLLLVLLTKPGHCYRWNLPPTSLIHHFRTDTPPALWSHPAQSMNLERWPPTSPLSPISNEKSQICMAV